MRKIAEALRRLCAEFTALPPRWNREMIVV
jgi:hypothetical protein